MWLAVEHGSEIIRHTDMAKWLAGTLNDLGATQFHLLQYDTNNDVFSAIAFVPDVEIPPAPELPPPVQKQAEYPGVVFSDD